MKARSLIVSLSASLAIACTIALAGCDSCDKPKPGGEGGAPSASASGSSSADAAAAGPGVLAMPGCRPRTPGGNVLTGKLEPGNVTVAVKGGKALVVNTVFKDPRHLDSTDPEGTLESAKSERVVLASNGLPDGPFEPVIEPHAGDEGASTLLTWAVATTFHDDLTTMSYGTGRIAGGTCNGGTLMLKGAGSPFYMLPDKHCRHASSLAGAARGDIAVALLDGPTELPILVKTWPAIVEAIVTFGGKPHSIRLEAESDQGKIARIEAPAAAVGKSLTAVAYRVVKPGSRELHVTILDISGKKVGKTEVVDKGDVGAPALAFEEDTLHVVWAARATDKEPYTLRWTKLSSTGALSATQRLSTGIGSAFAPALAIDDRGRVLVAWMEGDDKRGVVKVGMSPRGMAGAIAVARPVSNEGTNARDPEVGMDKGAMFLVWQEYGKTTQELRAAALECLE